MSAPESPMAPSATCAPAAIPMIEAGMASGIVTRANVNVNGEPTKMETAPVTHNSHVETVIVRPTSSVLNAWINAAEVMIQLNRVDHVSTTWRRGCRAVEDIALHSGG